MDKKLKHILSVVFNEDIKNINENSSSDTILNWDSIRHLNLILTLENEFNISIPDEEVGNLMNFKLIKLIISDLIK
jgi:acyl carrier protein